MTKLSKEVLQETSKTINNLEKQEKQNQHKY